MLESSPEHYGSNLNLGLFLAQSGQLELALVSLQRQPRCSLEGPYHTWIRPMFTLNRDARQMRSGNRLKPNSWQRVREKSERDLVSRHGPAFLKCDAGGYSNYACDSLVCIRPVGVGVPLAAADRSASPKSDALRTPDSPNIVLITLDTTRADRMGFLGAQRGLTPNLDALAREAIIFTHAYAQAPLTSVSHASILTGTYPQFHQVLDFPYPLAMDLPYVPRSCGPTDIGPRRFSAPGFRPGRGCSRF